MNTKRNYKYCFSLLPGMLVVFGNVMGEWYVATNVLFSLVLLGMAEFFVSENTDNNYDDDSSLPYVIMWLHVALQTAAMGSFIFLLRNGDVSLAQKILAALSVGVHSGSSAIILAHEFIHHKRKIMQWAGKYLLFTAGNIYFFVNHLRVHHKWVGTLRDPATSRFGENVNQFFWRSATQQIHSSYQLEKERTVNFRMGMLQNYVVWNVLLQILFLTWITWIGGILALSMIILQYLIANFLLEYVNYIEHYGLVRNENERAREQHSWQTDKVISRYFLIDLSRHADHHYYASKPYHTLVSYQSSPKLPGGYVQMIYYALIPPIWFHAIHKILADFKSNNNKN